MSEPVLICEESAECRFPADLHCVSLALKKMESYCRARGLRPAVWQELELATAEGLNNAIEHGCSEDAAKTVGLRWRWDENRIVVEIADPSDFLPDAQTAALPEDPFSEGGRGAFLIAQLTDSAEHVRVAGGHLLRLIKTVGPAAWQAEDAAEMDAVIESMAEELSRSYEDLSAVFRFAEELGASATLGEFLNRALARLLDLVQGEIAYLRLASKAHPALDLVRSGLAAVEWAPPRIELSHAVTETGVFHTREAATVENCRHLPEDDPLRVHGGSAFVCPIFFQSDMLGCLVVMRPDGRAYFSAGELGLIRVVADFLGIACTTSFLQEQRQAQQRALRELEIAASIQQSLLPRSFPDEPPYLIHGVCHSATQVGGDYFDALAVEGGVLLVIADVMGKGVPAALLASIFRTAVHARLELASRPDRLLTAVNRQISADLARNDMFITAQVAYLSRAEHTVLLADAGHCPMMLCSPEAGCFTALQGEGIPLGVMDDVVYSTVSQKFAAGDRLVMLTDGLYEVENAERRMLGMEDLTRQMEEFSSESPQVFCDRLLDWVEQFSGRVQASDDRTLLVVERLSQ